MHCQAIPAALDLLGHDSELFVISLAPPRPRNEEVPSGIPSQLLYWINYFPGYGLIEVSQFLNAFSHLYKKSVRP